MVAGGILAVFAFVLSAIVQFKVNTTLPDIPMEGHAFMSAMNAFDNCTLNICATYGNCRTLEPNGTLTNTDRERPELFELVAGLQSWRINGTGNCGAIQNMEVERMLHSGSTYWMMVGPMGILFGEADSEKPQGGMGEFRVGFTLALEDIEYQGNLALCRQQPAAGHDNSSTCDPRRAEDFVAWQVEDGELKAKSAFITQDGLTERNAAIYEFKSLFLMRGRPKVVGQETMSKGQLSLNETGIELEVRAQGGVYMIALTGNLSAADQTPFPGAEKRVFQVVPDNSLSILWQIPQIMVITAAEILFSVTGYEFAYSQAAPSMKSLVQALWLMTTAIGDIIILLITLIAFPNLAVEFLFYAAGMAVVIGILALLAIFYYEYNNNYTGGDICLSAAQLEGNGGKKQPLAGNVRSVQMFSSTSFAKMHLKGYKFPEISPEQCIEQHVRGWGPGGSCVNSAGNAVVLKHKQTNCVVRVHESRKLHENILIAYERLKFAVDRQLNGENSYEVQFEQLKRKYEERTKKSMGKKRALMAKFRERGEDIQRRAPCHAEKGAFRSEKDGD
uniref:Prokaryotic-type class I peptide chain release factors domain-containing protein n=1 Tax=Globodera rostochiensis TaxID=31243 RepID=A0A914HXL8_GLORO